MKRLLKLFDYLFVLRPVLFLPVWTVFLAGFFVQQDFGLAGTNADAAIHPPTAADTGFVWVALGITLLMGAAFILNQIQDRETDHENRKLFLIAHGHLTPKAAFIEAVILILASLVLGFLFSPLVGGLFFVILLVTGLLYSFRPFSWKDRPIWGLVANMLGTVLIFATGWLIDGGLNATLLKHALPYALAVGAVYLYTTLPDVEGDRSSNKVTFGVRYGFKVTVYAGVLLVVAAAAVGLALRDEVIFYPAFFSLPFYLWAAFKMEMDDVVRAVKYPILLLSLTVCVKWPEYFFVLVGIYAISKIYYKFRFGLNYPSLSS